MSKGLGSDVLAMDYTCRSRRNTSGKLVNLLVKIVEVPLERRKIVHVVSYTHLTLPTTPYV